MQYFMEDYKKQNLPKDLWLCRGLKGNEFSFQNLEFTSIGVTIDGDINSFSMGEATAFNSWCPNVY